MTASAWRRLRDPLIAAVALVVCVAALSFLFRHLTWSAFVAALLRQPPRSIGLALGCTALSFACLGAYDWLAAEFVARVAVRRRVALFAGAAGSAIANTVGFHAFSGTAVRARVYLAVGVSSADIARIVSLAWVSLMLGNATLFAVAECARAATRAAPLVPAALGGTLLAALAGFVAWLAGGRRALSLFGRRLPLPSARMALALLALGALESGTAIAALYVLVPPDLAPSFDIFAAGCIVSVVLGVLAHTPGGVGVFEAGMTALLGGAGRADLLAALLVYRAVYNLLPFSLAVSALLGPGRRLAGLRAPPAAVCASAEAASTALAGRTRGP